MIERLLLRLRKSVQQARNILYLSLQFILILVGSFISYVSGPTGMAIGTSILATGICGLVVFGWILFTEEEASRRKVVDSFGLVTAFPHRSIQIKHEYEARLRNASRRIDVMGYGLNALREDFVNQFSEWSSRAQVRILLVDPDTPHISHRFVDQRDVEERNNPGKTRDEILKFIDDTRHLWNNPDSKFSLRLALTLPSVNMFRIDDESFWGPYLISSAVFGRASRNLPTMIVRNPGYMYERLVDHFEEIWSNDFYSRAPDSNTRTFALNDAGNEE